MAAVDEWFDGLRSEECLATPEPYGEQWGWFAPPTRGGRCRQCGCWDYDACFDPMTLDGCQWVAERPCSVCAWLPAHLAATMPTDRRRGVWLR